MALSANVILEVKEQPVEEELKVVDGAIHIFQGALLNYEASNIGYVQLGSNTLSQEFAGIAIEEKNIAAADNASDGTYVIKVISRNSGRWVKLTLESTISIANEGDVVYVQDDDAVDLAANLGVDVNTTGGAVGTIRRFISANLAWVQLDQ